MRREYLVCLLLGLVTLAVFWPVTRADFVNYDDNAYVLQNDVIHTGLNRESAAWAFTTTYEANWHPLTWLSHELDCQMYGLKPAGHHVTNLLFHIANVLLLFGLLRAMTGTLWRSAVAAALFAWHPVHVESVAWVAERKDVLSTFFLMLTLLAYWKYVKGFGVQGSKFKVYYCLALLCFALGLMSKPMLVTLPFVMLLLDFWPLRRIYDLRFAIDERDSKEGASAESKALGAPAQTGTTKLSVLKLILEKTPFFVLAAASSVVTYLVQKQGGAMRSLGHLSIDSRIGNALVAYVGYLGKIFWPVHLAVYYPYHELLPEWTVMGAGVALFGITVWAVQSRGRRPYLAVGWFWFLGTLVPVIGLVQVGIASMADRYTYIPAIGIFIAAVWQAGEMSGGGRFRKESLAVATVLILGVLAVLARIQAGNWADSEALWRHELAVMGDNEVAEYSLGQALSVEGKIPDAIPHFSVALRMDPNDSLAHSDLGLCLAREGKYQEATYQYAQALSLSPSNAMTRYDYGLALAALGKGEDAEAQYRESIQLQPNVAEVHYDLGKALLRQGHLGTAEEEFAEAAKMKPTYAEAHEKLGLTYSLLGRSSQAAEEYEEAIRLNPNLVEPLNNLAWIRAANAQPELRNGAEAVRLAQHACELTGNREPALLGTLAAAYAEAGQFKEAVETGTKARDLALSHGAKELAARNEELLKQYRDNRAFHETPAQPKNDGSDATGK